MTWYLPSLHRTGSGRKNSHGTCSFLFCHYRSYSDCPWQPWSLGCSSSGNRSRAWATHSHTSGQHVFVIWSSCTFRCFQQCTDCTALLSIWSDWMILRSQTGKVESSLEKESLSVWIWCRNLLWTFTLSNKPAPTPCFDLHLRLDCWTSFNSYASGSPTANACLSRSWQCLSLQCSRQLCSCIQECFFVEQSKQGGIVDWTEWNFGSRGSFQETAACPLATHCPMPWQLKCKIVTVFSLFNVYSEVSADKISRVLSVYMRGGTTNKIVRPMAGWVVMNSSTTQLQTSPGLQWLADVWSLWSSRGVFHDALTHWDCETKLKVEAWTYLTESVLRSVRCTSAS